MQGRSKGQHISGEVKKKGALAPCRCLFQQGVEEHLPDACIKSSFEPWVQPLPSCILSFRPLPLFHRLSVICILSAPHLVLHPAALAWPGSWLERWDPCDTQTC